MLSIAQEADISTARIHPTAVVDSAARIGKDVIIGPFVVIESDVNIGDRTSISNHTTIKAFTTIGKDCQVYQNSVIGGIPQDLKFGDEVTHTKIGNNVIIREFVTINRGTKAVGKTTVGNNVMLMAYVHVAHDCTIGDNVILTNLVTLGGHVEIDEWAYLGGGVMVHQFSRVGAYGFVGGGYRVVQDVPPFIMAAGEPLKYTGINRIGLRRRDYSTEERQIIKKAYRLYFNSELNRSAALKRIREEFPNNKNIDRIINFISSSDRGII
jgi:UDP-N-acetylglucosamine acyltransferase